MSFTYDANGNLTTSTGVDARTVTFDNLDRPIQIVKGTAITIFRYAPDGSRYVQRTTTDASPYPKTVFYVDKLFERVVWNGATEEKTYVGPATVIYRNGTTRDVRYLSLDRLGSVEAVTTSSAAEYVIDQHSFDAFGKPRKGDFTTGIARLHSSDYNVTTEHGFTGHEHLDETYLIHMNGRVYDYQLGRFLSVDPIISNTANSQSINPYSYIGNNPLSGVDPTGYECSDHDFSRCDTIAVNDPGTPTLKKVVSEFVKSWNGAGHTDREGAPSDTNSPGQTGSKDEPGIGDLVKWVKEHYPSLQNDLKHAWNEYIGIKEQKMSSGSASLTVNAVARLYVHDLEMRIMIENMKTIDPWHLGVMIQQIEDDPSKTAIIEKVDATTVRNMVDSRGGPFGGAAVTTADTSRAFTAISPEVAMSQGAGQFYRTVAHELGHVYEQFYGPGVPIPRTSGAYDQRITEDRAYLFEDGLQLGERVFKWP